MEPSDASAPRAAPVLAPVRRQSLADDLAQRAVHRLAHDRIAPEDHEQHHQVRAHAEASEQPEHDRGQQQQEAGGIEPGATVAEAAEDARGRSRATVLDGIAFERVNERIDGLPYSLWELVYHLWVSQPDILVFIQQSDYKGHDWPDDYWPDEDATPESWADTTQAFQSDLARLVELVEDPARDLTAELDHAPGYTLLRQALLAADHNAHHLGEVIALRRLLGIWEPQT